MSTPENETPEWLVHGEGFADVTLTRQYDIAGTKQQTLRMREPTVRDQLANDKAKGSEATKEIALLSNLIEIGPDEIEQLSLRDYRRMQQALVGFID